MKTLRMHAWTNVSLPSPVSTTEPVTTGARPADLVDRVDHVDHVDTEYLIVLRGWWVTDCNCHGRLQ